MSSDMQGFPVAGIPLTIDPGTGFIKGSLLIDDSQNNTTANNFIGFVYKGENSPAQSGTAPPQVPIPVQGFFRIDRAMLGYSAPNTANNSNSCQIGLRSSAFIMGSAATLAWTNVSTNVATTQDVILGRDGAAGSLYQRDGTNAQRYNLYNTYTDASNYERGYLKWSSNTLQIGAEAAGTGVARNVTLSSQINARKTTDQSLTLTNTLTNDSHLSFAIGASEEWIADFNIDAGAALATTGVQIAITVPSGATLNVSTALMPDFLTGANSGMKRTTTSGAAMDFTALTQIGTGDAQLQLTVWVLNSTTPGTVQLQFAQSTSNATALTFRKGSFMRATRVA